MLNNNSIAPSGKSFTLDQLKALRQAGYSMVPLGTDKKPVGPWLKYQHEQPDDATLTDWVDNPDVLGIGIVGGAVSGNLKILDIETREVGDRSLAKLSDWGRQDLLNIGAMPVNVFAYPFGGYNAEIQQMVRDAGFITGRSSDGGSNAKNADRYVLRRQPMTNSTTFAQVKGYIDAARAERQWVILLFHEVNESGNFFAVTPAFLVPGQ